MKIKKFFWDYLYFTRIERMGIVFLVTLCVGALLLPALYGRFFRRSSPPNWAETPVLHFTPEKTAQYSPAQETSPDAGVPIRLFPFNPNTATQQELAQLGLPARTIKSILNYRDKGGTFRKPEDLSKIYTLSDEDFLRLKPWIQVSGQPAFENMTPAKHEQAVALLTPFDPNSVSAEQLQNFGLPPATVRGWTNYLSKGGKFRIKEDLRKLYALSETDFQRLLPFITLQDAAVVQGRPIQASRTYQVTAVDINTAQSSDLVQLPGIGEGWARRILNWRDQLGGFSTVEQIAETRSLPDSVFQKARPFLKIADQGVRKISINQANWEELNGHPYIESRQARWIIAYREQHGVYHSVDDLLRITEIKKDWLDKVRPYLGV